MSEIELKEAMEKFGIPHVLTPDELILALYQSKGVYSHVKGTIAEQAFMKKITEFGGLTEKVDDLNLSLRFDCHTLTNEYGLKSVEVKTLLKTEQFCLGYKDFRDVTLPSGRVWRTKARSVHEKFDFLAICLVNHTNDYRDFIYLLPKDIPRCKLSKSGKKFRKADQQWVEENYYAPNFRIRLPAEKPYLTDLKEALSG